MAEVRIEVGAIDGYRYLGIQPPLTKEQNEWLRAAGFSGSEVPSNFEVKTPDIGESYSEASMIADLHKADERALETAHEIARILTVGGDLVTVSETVQSIGFGHDLFGGKARVLG